MTLVLGLTGSIGMGKSTTAGFFRAAGVPVWDADAAVAQLYGPTGGALPALRQICPAAIGPEGVSRETLRAEIQRDPTLLPRIEAAVHPLVAADRRAFLAATRAPIAVLDIPLLFEKGHDQEVDATLVVTAPARLQRQRVLARGTMTEAQLDMILARQMPDAEKRARATHIVETLSLPQTEAYVQALIAYYRTPHA